MRLGIFLKGRDASVARRRSLTVRTFLSASGTCSLRDTMLMLMTTCIGVDVDDGDEDGLFAASLFPPTLVTPPKKMAMGGDGDVDVM